MKKIALITGGHLSPALATIDALQAEGWDVVYVGRKYHSGNKLSDEYQIITDRGIQFLPLTTGKLHRHSFLAAAGSLSQVPLGVTQAFKYALRVRPNVVISFGGYLSVPIVVAAYMLKIPSITHEQTRGAGLANKINAKFATKVAISFPESAQFFPTADVVLTGNPIRLQALQIKEIQQGIETLSDLPTIYITGGNQGAKEVNQMIWAIIKQLTTRYNVIHSLGTLISDEDWQYVNNIHHSLEDSNRYLYARYITPEHIGSVFQKADLVISRTGANTCTELAHLAKPCLLIPLPSGQKNEQLQNAKLLEALGIAEVHEQHTLTATTLLEHIDRMMRHKPHYQVNQELRQKYFPVDAAQHLVTLAAHLCQDH